jgi:hypothetical protein
MQEDWTTIGESKAEKYHLILSRQQWSAAHDDSDPAVRIVTSREGFSRHRPPAFVAQVSKPAVSPTSKSAERPQSCNLRVWKPATSPERLRGTQTCPSPLRFAATAPEPKVKAGKSAPLGLRLRRVALVRQRSHSRAGNSLRKVVQTVFPQKWQTNGNNSQARAWVPN